MTLFFHLRLAVSYCDLSIVSEVHSVSAPGTPHHGTAIKIKKSTTLGRTKPEMRKTTEVTVISRSPSIERKGLIKSPSTHEVKLTYAKVASSKNMDNVGPVEVVNVPARENAAILKPDNTPMEVKDLISSFEKQITNNKGPFFGGEGKKTKPEPSQPPNQASEELNQKFSSVKEELSQKMEESKSSKVEDGSEDTTAAKFLKNEMAAHEKVGEIWKEVHNIGPDKPSKPDEGAPPPPPPTPSTAQKMGFQQQQQPQPQIPGIRPRPPFPQQLGPRPPNQNPQQPMQRPPMQRPPFPQNAPQMRPPMMGPQGPRQPYPELGSGPFPVKPGPLPQREPSDIHMAPPPMVQQPPSPTSPRVNINAPPQK
ncbi:UNVERIFIED_CONTAM: hypothetical protein PYX00_008524 [Menopon gallinae]|uniref:Uncharacterized protein n=1 Tax=Menopon gallinae TaxID=328185 RepID=A0AAW2HNQ2_9NEOP